MTETIFERLGASLERLHICTQDWFPVLFYLVYFFLTKYQRSLIYLVTSRASPADSSDFWPSVCILPLVRCDPHCWSKFVGLAAVLSDGASWPGHGGGSLQ